MEQAEVVGWHRFLVLEITFGSKALRSQLSKLTTELTGYWLV